MRPALEARRDAAPDVVNQEQGVVELGASIASFVTWVLFAVPRDGVRKGPKRRPDPASHPTRDLIVKVIRESPGASASELCVETGRRWGTVQYHLRLLERGGIVRALPTGRQRRFFLGHKAGALEHNVALLRMGRIKGLVRLILEKPGQAQKDLTSQVGITRKSFRRYRDLLVAAKLLRESRQGRTRRYFPTDALRQYAVTVGAER